MLQNSNDLSEYWMAIGQDRLTTSGLTQTSCSADRTEHDEERASDPLITVMTIIDQSVRLLGWKRREALRFARHSRAHC
jgi:hypothetical protein